MYETVGKFRVLANSKFGLISLNAEFSESISKPDIQAIKSLCGSIRIGDALEIRFVRSVRTLENAHRKKRIRTVGFFY